ncbi:hypothetical protein RI367_001860 [Sorochytrium milnesiophthora]
MFKKAHHIKGSNVLKSSQARKLKSRLTQQFPALRSFLDSAVPQVAAEKVTLSDESTATVYCADDGFPFAVEQDNVLFPTLPLCWKTPVELPLLSTHPPVIEKLKQGADFMLPGLATPTAGMPVFGIGDIVGICSTDTPQVPVVVGITLMSTADIAAMPERHGKLVSVLHFSGDTLCTRVKVTPAIPPVPATATAGSSSPDPDTNRDAPDAEKDTPPAPPAQPQDNVSSEDMDKLFMSALFHAIKTKLSSTAVEFPIELSTFNSAYLLPCREPGTTLDIKKTSWKKLSKFAKQMEKARYMKIKEKSGEITVLSVNKQHDDVRFYEPKGVEPQPVKPSTPPQAATGSMIEVTLLYKPTGNLITIVPSRREADGYMTKDEVARALDEYIAHNNLQIQAKGCGTSSCLSKSLADPKCPSKRLIKLDLALHHNLLSKAEDVNQMPYNMVLERLLGKLQPAYRLVSPGQEPTFHKGHLKPVEVITETRQGHKLATLIRNLDKYGVQLADVARVLSALCASSASIAPDPQGGKDGQEVMVQGQKVKQVMQVLLQYGIPPQLITQTNKVKGKKKAAA